MLCERDDVGVAHDPGLPVRQFLGEYEREFDLHALGNRRLAEKMEEVARLAWQDQLTKLPNRLHFRSEADKLMSEALDRGQSAMLFVDLDRFKLVNDSLGHARGDQLLIMVANRLRVVVNAEFTGAARSQTQAVVRRVEAVVARHPGAAAYTPGAIL